MAKTLPSQCRGPDLILDQGTRPCSLQLRVSVWVCVCVCVCVCVHGQLCPALCNPMDYIGYQAPLSIEFSRQECWKKERKEGRKKEKSLSRVWLFATPWTVAHQAPWSKGFSRQEYWSRLPFPPPGDLPHPGIEPESLVSPARAGGFFSTAKMVSCGMPQGFSLTQLMCVFMISYQISLFYFVHSSHCYSQSSLLLPPPLRVHGLFSTTRLSTLQTRAAILFAFT